MRHLERILSRLENVRPQGHNHLACCPAHNDARPSLTISLHPDGYVRLCCRSAHCPTADILRAMNLIPTDLLPDPGDDIIIRENTSHVVGDSEALANSCLAVGEENLELRNRVYAEFLQALTLSDQHRSDLQRRGLIDTEIDTRSYRSLTFASRREALAELRSEFTDTDLLSVPGFAESDGTGVSIVGPSAGLVVPVRDLSGRIVALKVRRDDGDDQRGKYGLISGGGGRSCGIPTHVPLGIRGPVSEVRITEGELKSDVATVLSGLPTIGFPGVDNWSAVIPVLQDLGAQTVRLAFDADWITKPQVEVRLRECATALRAHGYIVVIETWQLENGKGIDDLLAAGHSPELLAEGDEGVRPVLAIEVEVASPCNPPTVGTAEAALCLESSIAIRDCLASTEVVLPFPVQVFPHRLQHFARQAAESIPCPLDLVAIPMLGMAATAIGASRALEVKPGWRESSRVYLATVAPPGSGKSPAESLVTRAVFRLQNRFKRQHQEELAAYAAVIAQHSQTRGRRGPRSNDAAMPVAHAGRLASDSVSSAGETENSTAVPANSLLTTTTEPPLPPKPVLRRIATVDATTESLAPLLANNPRGMVTLKDELSGWISSMNQYKGGKGSDRQFYLSCWSGQPAIVDRKSQPEPIIVARPFLNVIGGIQPDMLSVLRDEQGRADGFVDRILFAYPNGLGVPPWSEQGVDEVVERDWSQPLELLFRLEMRHCEDEGIDLPQTMHLTQDGRAAWVEWYNAHAREMESPDLAAILKGPWSKLRSYCLRLALVIHLLRLVCNEVDREDVDAESVTRAIQLIDYFKSHARKVYRHLHRDADDRRIEQVVAWIRSHDGECCARDLQRANVAGIKKASDANQVMKDLVDLALGDLQDRASDNHRKVTYFVLGGAASGRVG